MVRLAARLVVIAAAVLAAAPSPAVAAERILTTERLGPVRLGMTVVAAQRALHARLVPLGGSRQGACWYARRAGGADPAVAYMVEYGRITRIDIAASRPGASAVVTRLGIGIGATEQEIARRYGGDIRFEPHPIAGHARWALIEQVATGGIRVHLDDGRVVAMWAGQGPALDYPEGCS